jgi:SAM-dependent methyltransferase
MPRDSAIAPAAGGAALANRSFYDALWSQTRLARPERFNTWPLVAGLLPEAAARLEIGPGLRPRLPIAGTHFVDLSAPVIEQLNARGALAQLGEATVLPFEDKRFDLVCAFDVIEHVEDDLPAFAELSRVLKEDGVLIFSVPLHAGLWTAFDDFVGHVRRYEPAHLTAILQKHKLVPEKSAVFGMQPASPRLLAWGIWFLTHRRSSALFWYNWVFLPLCLCFQKPLKFNAGLLDTGGADEIVLVCRRGKGSAGEP